ncbi:unnamed protein product [Cyprideis torosa]|uniref:Uncharacterized protein n=1 Tax=Cyprideis torosa TaxID=163714 RepID=A0A7R8WJU8_9CRUS|nr:unnamed protein product [Cyprideis torosa]CAG0896192.1 unnamed protein product [Cyprideis torosa]
MFSADGLKCGVAFEQCTDKDRKVRCDDFLKLFVGNLNMLSEWEAEDNIESLQSFLQESEKAVEESEAKISSMSSELSELKKVADELEILKGHFQVETEKSNQLSSSLEEARVQMAEAKSDLALCQQKERELLELTDKLTEENVTLRSSTSALKEQVTQLQEDLSEVSSLKEQQVQKTEAARECVTSLEAELQSLRLSNQEKDKEKEDLALKIVALEDEIRATKKKHTVALKDLSRELVACRRRLEEGGSAVPLRERPSPTAPGPSSEKAPKRRDDSQEIDRVPAVHPSADPSLPSQEMLIRKVVRLQQALVRRREKMDGMEEHRKQLIRELGKKTKIIQHYVLGKQTDALTSCEADCIKENLHTMGEEIARLMAPPPTQKASAAGNKAK